MTTATYDALGRMVEKGLSGVYTQFVYRPSGGLLAVYSGSLSKGTISLPGGSTAVYTTGGYNGTGLSYIRHKDWLGSSRLATTWQHGVYSKEAYAPFGETYNEAGTPDRSFTGQDQNVATGSGGNGAYDFLFRKYDPSAGRWLSPDPAGWKATNQAYPQSLNRYAYVQNNPMSTTDPDGRACVTATDGVVSIDNQGPIGDACTGNGGIYVPGDMQASDWNALLAGQMTFSMIDAEGNSIFYGSGDAADLAAAGISSSAVQEALNDLAGALLGPSATAMQSGAPSCSSQVLSAVNSQFGTNLSDSNVSGSFQYSTGAPAGQGTLNLNISTNQPSGVSPGYYPMNWLSYIIGYGATLHIVKGPGGVDSSSTLQFSQSQYTAHIDSAYPYGIGLVFHLLIDMGGAGGYQPCP